MLSKDKAYTQFKEHESITEAGLDLHYQLAELNHQFYSGDEMAYRVSVTDKKSRKIVVFNRIKPFINSITGFMIKLRRMPDYQARLQDNQLQQQYSESTNAFSAYIRADANSAQIESRQDKEMLITGIGAVDNSISYVKNPNGEVLGATLRFDEVGWDPQARETNILDSRWVYRRKVMNRDDAAEFFSADPDDFEDEASPLMNRSTRSRLYAVTDAEEEEDLVQVFYYQWWQFESYYRIDNPLFDDDVDVFVKQELAQALTLLGDDVREEEEEKTDTEVMEDLFTFNPASPELVVTTKTRKIIKALFEEFGIEIDEVKQKRKVYYTAIISGKKVFDIFKSQDQNGFTIKFKTGDYDEVRNLWHGMVDQLREPSRYSNKAFTEILYVIASNSKGGVMYERDAVQDSAKFEQQWATTDAAIRVNDGALSGGKIQAKAQAVLPNGYENILEAAKAGMFEVSGINPEFLGSSENKQVSALLESQRIEQVVSTLATYFDSITLYQKEAGKLNLTYMRVIFENNPDVLIRVMGKDGQNVWQNVDAPALTAEYGVDVQEMPTTPAQRAENLTVMMGFADKMMLGGINVYPAIVDDLPISQAQKERISRLMPSDELTPEQQQAQQIEQQMAQKAKELALEGQAQENEKTKAEVVKLNVDTGKSQADTEKSQADTVKTIQEAEQVDIENEQLALAGADRVSFVI